MVLATLLVAGWRLWLGVAYAGWEESDYGNLAMIHGVLEGGFRHYDMNHMPGYYALGAVVHAVVGDAVIAGRTVALLGGVAAWVLAVRLTALLASPRAAVLAGLLLAVQPEFSLYAASSLREPVYAAFVLATLWGIVRGREVQAGLWASAAFLVRFDAAAILGAVLLLHAIGAERGKARRAVRSLLPLVITVFAWSLYCRVDHGTFAFWSHAVQVNVETGLGAEAEGRGAWLAHGLRVVAGLGAWLLPWRIGWGIWAGAVLAVVLTPWTRPSPQRTVVAAGGALAGFWLAVGFVGQHDPGHNLYWKWMLPLVPVLVPMGAAALDAGATVLGKRRGRWAELLLIGLVVGQALVSELRETRRQVDLSATLYAPQRDLGRWFEGHIPADVPLLIDNIPACWIDRRAHERTLHSWFDVPVSPGDEAALAAWLDRTEVGWVLWFREDWTQAPGIAPVLAHGGTWESAGVQLTEVAREDAYGWILYEVTAPPGRSGRSHPGQPIP
mgnify:CR=1 FL=1